MMKGLFNYETAYRSYTRKLLSDFADDNIQYAEVRPNFMQNNQVLPDDGRGAPRNNFAIMDMIIEAFEEFQLETKGKKLHGLKVIYCTPRSFDEDKVAACLKECLAMKRHEKYGRFIAGMLIRSHLPTNSQLTTTRVRSRGRRRQGKASEEPRSRASRVPTEL
jgi:adenosine deaminase CECR1